MRLRFTSNLATSPAEDNRLFVMFHGYGNDESEMVRIIDAVYAQDAHGAQGAQGARSCAEAHGTASLAPQPLAAGAAPESASTPFDAEPSYLSFRGTYSRPYMGGHYWYPDGCGVEERQRECASVGETVTKLVSAPLFQHRRIILVGFSQGGYLSYRLVKAYPRLFSAAILLSPSFKGEEGTTLESSTRFFLAYGTNDHTIPLNDQHNAHTVLENAGHLTYRAYPGMGHAICDEEISDIRGFLNVL